MSFVAGRSVWVCLCVCVCVCVCVRVCACDSLNFEELSKKVGRVKFVSGFRVFVVFLEQGNHKTSLLTLEKIY